MSVVAIAGGIFASNFNKYFIMFHHMFFDNDLWLLDPATDLMIRMLPEGFFFDMVIRIVVTFLIAMAIFFIFNSHIVLLQIYHIIKDLSMFFIKSNSSICPQNQCFFCKIFLVIFPKCYTIQAIKISNLRI